MTFLQLAVAFHDSVIFCFPFLGNSNFNASDLSVVVITFRNSMFVLLLVVVEVGGELGGVATRSAGVLQLIFKLMDLVL